MPSIAERCDALADMARALADDVRFRESFAMSSGHLTLSHVSLHGAKLAARRAAEAIDRVAMVADSYVKEDPSRHDA